MPNKYIIEIDLPLPGGKELKDCNNAELAAAMNREVDAFDKYMRGLDQDRLVPAERTLLKTYLAWKILHAKDDQSTKD